jgi:hypothetical protein
MLVTHTFSCKWVLVHFEFSLTHFERFSFFVYIEWWLTQSLRQCVCINDETNFKKTTSFVFVHCTIKNSFHATIYISKNHYRYEISNKSAVHLDDIVYIYPLLIFRYRTPEIMMKGPSEDQSMTLTGLLHTIMIIDKRTNTAKSKGRVWWWCISFTCGVQNQLLFRSRS